jgi:hypothetical protein
MLKRLQPARAAVVLLIVSLVSADAARNSVLFGRWRSDTAETGYWIIDRHADGRYAKKQYLKFDLSKPAELSIEWGHWQLEHNKYSDIIDGTTSSFLKQFIGKRTSWKILE